MINVIITDDHPIVTEGIKNLLNDQPDIRITGCFVNGAATLLALPHTFADVILLDINLPDINGITLCKKIKQEMEDVKIVALSIHNERAVIRSMLQNGADAYVLKNALGDEILQAIRTVYDGGTYLCNATRQALEGAAADELSTVPHITRREKEILQLVGKGHTTQQIASDLFISPHTVESHRKKLMEKFGVNNMASVVKMATDYHLL